MLSEKQIGDSKLESRIMEERPLELEIFKAFRRWCSERKERYISISDEEMITLWLEYEEEKAKGFPYK